MLPLEANSVSEKEQKDGVKREQITGRVTADGDQASVQMIGMRGLPWQWYLFNRETMWMILLLTKSPEL